MGWNQAREDTIIISALNSNGTFHKKWNCSNVGNRRNRIFRKTVCYSKNIILPQQLLTTQINNLSHAIFRYHATSPDLVVIDDVQFQNKDNVLCTTYNLPTFECNSESIVDNGLVFNNNYGLYSFGGVIQYDDCDCHMDTIYLLPWDSKKKKAEWKWKKLQLMKYSRRHPSVVNITSSNKIMIIGGQNCDSTLDRCYRIPTELYDLEKNKLNLGMATPDENYINGGVTYCNKKERVYIGGGHVQMYGMQKNVEYFDFVKNEWYALPQLQFTHTNGCCMWMDEHLLFIASRIHKESKVNIVMEYIDMRINRQEWKSNNIDVSYVGKEMKSCTAICSSFH